MTLINYHILIIIINHIFFRGTKSRPYFCCRVNLCVHLKTPTDVIVIKIVFFFHPELRPSRNANSKVWCKNGTGGSSGSYRCGEKRTQHGFLGIARRSAKHSCRSERLVFVRLNRGKTSLLRVEFISAPLLLTSVHA